MDITQRFYDGMASEYDKLFSDWDAAVKDQAEILDRIFSREGLKRDARVLDCACGIGTQAIGLASLGYPVTASDISAGELSEARERAEKRGVGIRFEQADFRALSDVFAERFDAVIAMDNALPHMLTRDSLETAVRSMADRVLPGGIVVISIRDYDAVLKDRPPYSPPYIYPAADGRRVCFQTWDWDGDRYRLTQYIIDDGKKLGVSKSECEYRAVRREELTELFQKSGLGSVSWKFPEETGFYQPVAVARK